MSIPGGWYDDPWSPFGLRWWDGVQWTPHSAPRPYPVGGYVRPVTPADLDGVERWARIARVALLVAAVLTCAELLTYPFVLHHVLHDWVHRIRVYNDQLNTDPNTVPGLNLDPAPIFALDAMSLVLLVPEILFIVWLYQAAELAKRLGIPSRRSPVWAILGFVVPIVNFWFPYQVAVGLLPPNDPHRRTVGWWWGLYLTQGLVVLPVLIVCYFSITAAVLIGVVGSILPIMAALKGRAVISAASHAHRAILGQ